jgi:hypothetical protein
MGAVSMIQKWLTTEQQPRRVFILARASRELIKGVQSVKISFLHCLFLWCLLLSKVSYSKSVLGIHTGNPPTRATVPVLKFSFAMLYAKLLYQKHSR